MANKIIIKQVKSAIGSKPKQRATLKALGLRKINAEKIHENNDVIKGMIDKVGYLIEVKNLSE